jgi:hypothetical protein
MDPERALDELYDAAPEGFVAERKRLAKELKADGHGDDADRLAKLRKPTVAAWALNRLAREERRDIDLLLDSGHRLRTAQAGVLRGEARDAFEEAQRTERDAVARLVRAAERLLAARGGGSASVLEQVAASLHAAAISDDARELLARGRFTQPLALEGFDVLTGLAPPTRKPARKRPSRAEETKRAREELAAARRRLREAERIAQDAHRRAAEADAEVESATKAVREAEKRLRP